jgi:hypothetical protein
MLSGVARSVYSTCKKERKKQLESVPVNLQTLNSCFYLDLCGLYQNGRLTLVLCVSSSPLTGGQQGKVSLPLHIDSYSQSANPPVSL